MRRAKRRRAEAILVELARLLDVPIQVNTKTIGRRFELLCARKCESMGFQVIDTSSQQLCYDLVVNGHRVQCKTRKLRSCSRRSTEIRLQHRSTRPYRVDEVDFFIIRHGKKILVVPSDAISRDDGTVKGTVDVRSLLQFVDAWKQLDGDSIPHERQASLPFGN